MEIISLVPLIYFSSSCLFLSCDMLHILYNNQPKRTVASYFVFLPQNCRRKVKTAWKKKIFVFFSKQGTKFSWCIAVYYDKKKISTSKSHQSMLYNFSPLSVACLFQLDVHHSIHSLNVCKFWLPHIRLETIWHGAINFVTFIFWLCILLPSFFSSCTTILYYSVARSRKESYRRHTKPPTCICTTYMT